MTKLWSMSSSFSYCYFEIHLSLSIIYSTLQLAFWIYLLHLLEACGILILILTPLLWLGSDCEGDESLCLGPGAVQCILSRACPVSYPGAWPVCRQPGTRGHQDLATDCLGSSQDDDCYMLHTHHQDEAAFWVKVRKSGSSGWTTSGRLRTSPTLTWGPRPRAGSPQQWPSSRKQSGNRRSWPSSS